MWVSFHKEIRVVEDDGISFPQKLRFIFNAIFLKQRYELALEIDFAMMSFLLADVFRDEINV